VVKIAEDVKVQKAFQENEGFKNLFQNLQGAVSSQLLHESSQRPTEIMEREFQPSSTSSSQAAYTTLISKEISEVGDVGVPGISDSEWRSYQIALPLVATTVLGALVIKYFNILPVREKIRVWSSSFVTSSFSYVFSSNHLLS